MRLKEVIAVADWDKYFASFVCPHCGHEQSRQVNDATWFMTYTLPNWMCPKCHKREED